MLRAEGVTVVHDTERVLDGLDLAVGPGELVAVRGPSGSGKSTVLAVLGGLLPHSRAGRLWGRVLLDGRDVTAEPPWQRAAWLGFLAQDPASSLCLTTVRDEVALPLENAAVPREDIGPRVAAVAARVGITHLLDRQTHQLSGGEQQRVALAATLVAEPRYVLLDEPLSMLDPDAAADVAAVLRREVTAGPGVVIVEHRVAELDAAGLVPDRVLALGRPAAPPGEARAGRRPGAVVLERTLRDVRRDAAGPVVLPAASVRLRAGTVTALTGPNGSGKTTLLMALAGLLPGAPAPASVGVGLVFQRPENQFVASTVLAEASYRADPAVARSLLEDVGLAGLEDRDPHTLSIGQQRRLSVVAMAAQGQPVLLLDEPTFGLDDAGAAAVESVIAELAGQGRAIMVSTHDRGLVRRLADDEVRLPAPPAGERPPPRPRVPVSFLSRCSPVLVFAVVFCASLGLLFTTALWPVLALWAAVTAAVPVLGRVPVRRVLRFQIPLAWFALSAFLVNALARTGEGAVVGSWGPFVVTDAGLAMGSALAARTLAIGALASAFVLTTDAVAFLNALYQQARAPVRVAFALLAGFRLMELLPDEWRTLRAAHAVRAGGVRERVGGPAWFRTFARASFGLLVVALRRGQQLAEALEARGLGRTPRTVWRPLRWGWRDAVLAAGALAAGAVLAVAVAAGWGPSA